MTLDLLGEDVITFIDKLNKLERINYLTNSYSANWWMSLREIRNQLSHDYPDDYALIATYFSILIGKVNELLQFWEVFKKKLTPLLKMHYEK